MAFLDIVKNAASKASQYVGQKYESAEKSVKSTITRVSNSARAQVDKVMQGVASFAPLTQPAGSTGATPSIQPQMPAKPASPESKARAMEALSGSANLTAAEENAGTTTQTQPTAPSNLRKIIPPQAPNAFIPDPNATHENDEHSTVFNKTAREEVMREVVKGETARLHKEAQKRAAQEKLEDEWFQAGETINPKTGLPNAYDNDQEAQQAVHDYWAVRANNNKARAEKDLKQFRRQQNHPLKRLVKALAPTYYLNKYAETGNHNVPPTAVIAQDAVSGIKGWFQRKAAGVKNAADKLLGRLTDKYLFSADEAVKPLEQEAKTAPQAVQLTDLEEANWFKEGQEINPDTGHLYCHDQAVEDAVATVEVNRFANDVDQEAAARKAQAKKRKISVKIRAEKEQFLRTFAPNRLLRNQSQPNTSSQDPAPNSVQVVPESEKGKTVDTNAPTVYGMEPHDPNSSTPSGTGSNTPTLPPSGGNGGNENTPPSGDGDGPDKKKAGFWSQNKYLKLAVAGIMAIAGATGIYVAKTTDTTQSTKATASASASSKPAGTAPTAKSAKPKTTTTAKAIVDAGAPDATEDSSYVAAQPPSTGEPQTPVSSTTSAPATPTTNAPKVAVAPRPAPKATPKATPKPAPTAASTGTTAPELPPKPPKVAYNTRTEKDPRDAVAPQPKDDNPYVEPPAQETPAPKPPKAEPKPEKVSKLPPIPKAPKPDPARPENKPLTEMEAKRLDRNFLTMISQLRDNAEVVYNGRVTLHDSRLDAPRTKKTKRPEEHYVTRVSGNKGDKTTAHMVKTPLNEQTEELATEKHQVEWALTYADILRRHMTHNTTNDDYMIVRGRCGNTNKGCPAWTTYNAEKLKGLVDWVNDKVEKRVEPTVAEGKAINIERAQSSIDQARTAAQSVRNHSRRQALLSTLATLEASLARAKSGTTPNLEMIKTIHRKAQANIATAQQDSTYRPNQRNANSGSTTVSYSAPAQ